MLKKTALVLHTSQPHVVANSAATTSESLTTPPDASVTLNITHIIENPSPLEKLIPAGPLDSRRNGCGVDILRPWYQ
jgi:hypothetical protein